MYKRGEWAFVNGYGIPYDSIIILDAVLGEQSAAPCIVAKAKLSLVARKTRVWS